MAGCRVTTATECWFSANTIQSSPRNDSQNIDRDMTRRSLPASRTQQRERVVAFRAVVLAFAVAVPSVMARDNAAQIVDDDVLIKLERLRAASAVRCTQARSTAQARSP